MRNLGKCVLVGGYTNGLGGNAHGVAVLGNYAYVANGEVGLQVIDVSNPTFKVIRRLLLQKYLG